MAEMFGKHEFSRALRFLNNSGFRIRQSSPDYVYAMDGRFEVKLSDLDLFDEFMKIIERAGIVWVLMFRNERYVYFRSFADARTALDLFDAWAADEIVYTSGNEIKLDAQPSDTLYLGKEDIRYLANRLAYQLGIESDEEIDGINDISQITESFDASTTSIEKAVSFIRAFGIELRKGEDGLYIFPGVYGITLESRKTFDRIVAQIKINKVPHLFINKPSQVIYFWSEESLNSACRRLGFSLGSDDIPRGARRVYMQVDGESQKVGIYRSNPERQTSISASSVFEVAVRISELQGIKDKDDIEGIISTGLLTETKNMTIERALSIAKAFGIKLDDGQPGVDPQSSIINMYRHMGTYSLILEPSDYGDILNTARELGIVWLGCDESQSIIFFITQIDLHAVLKKAGCSPVTATGREQIWIARPKSTLPGNFIKVEVKPEVRCYLENEDVIDLATRLVKEKGIDTDDEVTCILNTDVLTESLIGAFGKSVLNAAGYNISKNDKGWFDYHIRGEHFCITLLFEKEFDRLIKLAQKHQIVYTVLHEKQGSWKMYLKTNSDFIILCSLISDSTDTIEKYPVKYRLLKRRVDGSYITIGEANQSQRNSVLGMSEDAVLDLIKRLELKNGVSHDETEGSLNIDAITEEGTGRWFKTFDQD